MEVRPESHYLPYINWLISSGISRGCDPPENLHFCPNRALIRGEAATFLARAFALPSMEEDYFTDDTGNTHEGNINSLAAPDITRGCNPPVNKRYCPMRKLTRAEMASFLVRAFDLPLSESNYFDDDEGNTHELQINSIATLGISRGCNPPTNNMYCPERIITRQEMAVFLYRTIDFAQTRLGTLDRLPPLLGRNKPEPAVFLYPTTRQPFGVGRLDGLELFRTCYGGEMPGPVVFLLGTYTGH